MNKLTLIVISLFLIVLTLSLTSSADTQGTCSSGSYKLNGNLEVTGTVTASNVKSTSAAETQTSCVKVATLNTGSSGSCYGYLTDTKTVTVPDCVKTGHCYFILKKIQPQTGDPETISEFITFPGASDSWIATMLSPAQQISTSSYPYSRYNVPNTQKGLFGGQLAWPYNAPVEQIMSGGTGGFGTCSLSDDAGDRNSMQLTLQSCIIAASCEFWACP